MDIFSIVKTVILEATETDVMILGHTYLQNELMLDSLKLTYLIVALEEEMDVEVDLSLLVYQSLETVDDLCNLIQKSINQE